MRYNRKIVRDAVNLSKRIVMLDIDGVLNIFPYCKHKYLISDKVLLLNWLSATIGCRYVITSLWRRYFSLDEIKKRLLDKGLASKNLIVGATPDLGGFYPRRYREIYTWLGETHDLNWIVLDDMVIPEIPQERYFQTNAFKSGLTKEIASDIARYYST